MKKLLLIAASLTFACQAVATSPKELVLPAQAKANYSVVGNVDIKGKKYQKVVKTSKQSLSFSTRSMATNVELFEGDLLKKGELSNVSTLSGKFFLSMADSGNISAVAQQYNLTVEYTKDDLAVVKANKGVELSSLLKALTSDTRISVVELEKVTNKMSVE